MGGIVSSIGSAIGGLFGGNSAPSAPNVNIYQPAGTPQIDAQLQGLLSQDQSLINNLQSYAPQIQQAFQSLYNSPTAGGYQAGANAAGNAYNMLGNQGALTGNLLSNASIGLLPGAMNVEAMGLDPQSQLYARMLQQASDVGNVSNAMYGLTGQQAAGNEAQSINNFNMDWQNQQLSRAIAGLQGAGQGVAEASRGATAGQNVGSAGAGSLLAGGQVPYQASQNIGTGQQSALSTALGQSQVGINALNPAIQSLLSYLSQGVNASQAGQSANLADYYAQLQGATSGAVGGGLLGSQLYNGFSGAGSLGGLFGGTQAASSVADAASGAFGAGDFGSLTSAIPEVTSTVAGGGGFLSGLADLFAFL